MCGIDVKPATLLNSPRHTDHTDPPPPRTISATAAILLVLFVGHERQEGVPAYIGDVHEEELEAQGDEGEVDELQRGPHDAVRLVGAQEHLLGVVPAVDDDVLPCELALSELLGMFDLFENLIDQFILLIFELRVAAELLVLCYMLLELSEKFIQQIF